MKPLTREWLKKAEADFATAQRELRVRRTPNRDAVCFHAQQCAEKYLKACLQEADVAIPRTHDLAALLDLLLTKDPLLETLRSALNLLSSYAVEVRYPGEAATKEHAEEALSRCRHIREVLSERLGVSMGRTRKGSRPRKRRPRSGR
jgi:HEPN domain-containing protein